MSSGAALFLPPLALSIASCGPSNPGTTSKTTGPLHDESYSCLAGSRISTLTSLSLISTHSPSGPQQGGGGQGSSAR